MALDNFRTQKIIWDKANKKIFEAIEANAGDSNGRKLVVQIINQEVSESLSGTTLSLGWKSRKGAKGLDVFKVVDASKGIFEIYYTTEMLSNIGNLEASLILINSTDRIESSAFTISVRPSTVDDESVESENSFTALTEALVRVNDFSMQLAQTENNISALENDKADKIDIETTNERVDNLIIGSGNANAEVADAHISTPRNDTFETISKRFEQVELEMIENVLLNATNLLENGNFKDGTTGWTSSDDLTTSNNTLNVHRATTGTSPDVSATYTLSKNRENGHIYYYRADIKMDNHATTRGLYLRLWAPGHTIMYDDPIPGSFQTHSAIIPAKEEYRNDRSFTVGARYQNPQATENTNTQIKNVLVIDLTATFGIGNEPDKEVIDFIIDRYYDIYFDGTKALLSLEKTAVVNYESERILNELLNEGFLNGDDCEVTSLNGLTIQFKSGELYKNLNTVEVPSKTLEIATPDKTYTRYDIVAVDHKGELQVIEGATRQWREPPIINDDYQKVAEIRVPANATSISNSDIEDLRTFSKVNLLSSKVATVIVAASNSSHYDKSIADYVCDGQNDEVEIQKALDRFIYRSGTVRLANGDYYIDSLYDTGSSFSGSFGVVIKKPEIQREVVIEGANAPIRMLDRTNILSGKNSPVLHLRKALYDTLATDELVTLVGVLPYNLDTGAIRYPAISFNIYKLGIQIPDNKKTIRCIDLYYASMAKTEDVLIMSEVHDGHNIATEGIRGLRGHNFGTGYAMKNMFMWGMGIAYNISGEHLIMENCGARYSLYPFAFGLTPEQNRNGHPITMINCTHESCVNGPIFGENPNKQFITIIDYNIEHGNQQQNAIELVPGSFTGSINYGIVGYPGQHDYINVDYPFWEDDGSGKNFISRNVAHNQVGTTDERPVYPNHNQQYFDTDLNKMIYYINGLWKDAMGTSV